MNNQALLAQARRGVKMVIDLNPVTLTVTRAGETDDGFGGKMPSGTTTATVRGRISHEQRGVATLQDYPSGLDTSLSLYLLSQDTIKENDIFTERGRSWRLGPVDALIKFGGVLGYQAPMIPE